MVSRRPPEVCEGRREALKGLLKGQHNKTCHAVHGATTAMHAALRSFLGPNRVPRTSKLVSRMVCYCCQEIGKVVEAVNRRKTNDLFEAREVRASHLFVPHNVRQVLQRPVRSDGKDPRHRLPL